MPVKFKEIEAIDMDDLGNVLLRLVEPFVFPFLPQTRLYWLYLLTAVAIAYGVYRRSDRARFSRFVEFVVPKTVYLHRSALVDYRYFVVNHISFVFLIAPLLLSASAVGTFTRRALESFAGPLPGEPAGITTLALYTVCLALAYDFGIFIVHYAMHRFPTLWEFHKVHHSAEVLTPVTVYRVHPLEDLLYGATTGAATGLVHGIFAFALGGGITVVTVLNVDAALFAFYLLGYNLRHSHIWLAYPDWLSRILISPAQHQIHHSIHPRHLDKNMGFMFAMWDAMMNTLYVPERREDLVFGLGDGKPDDYNGVLALYVVPFRKIFERWRVKWLART